MNIKVCSCPMCRYGRHKGWGKHIMRSTTRKGRRMTKQILRECIYKDEDAWEKLPTAISAGYTD